VSKENLIPVTKDNAREMGRKGGLKGGKVRSPAKKYAAHLRELKKKGLNNAGAKRLVEFMENPECSVFQIKKFLDDIKDERGDKMSDTAVIQLIKAYIDLSKAHHGDKKKIEGNLNVRTFNVNLNIEVVKPERDKQ